MDILYEISTTLQRGMSAQIGPLVKTALNEGKSPSDILDLALIPGMNIIGEKFKNNEIYIPEVLMAANAMKIASDIIRPYLVESGVKSVGKCVIGTVKGDMHDIGKNLVKMMLEGKGLEVIDLGVNVPAQRFFDTATNEGCKVVCCSALLTTTMNEMKNVVEKFISAGVRNDFHIMVGGAPVNAAFCQSIGADAYTPDAASASEKALSFFQ